MIFFGWLHLRMAASLGTQGGTSVHYLNLKFWGQDMKAQVFTKAHFFIHTHTHHWNDSDVCKDQCFRTYRLFSVTFHLFHPSPRWASVTGFQDTLDSYMISDEHWKPWPLGTMENARRGTFPHPSPVSLSQTHTFSRAPQPKVDPKMLNLSWWQCGYLVEKKVRFGLQVLAYTC